MKRPRLLLADDHVMIAQGLKSLLSGEFDLVGVAEDGLSLVETARVLRPDVIVTDISMPQMNGIDAIRRIRRDNPTVKIVVLTMHQSAAYARSAFDAGASAFVVKHSAPAEFITAINAVLKGKTFITPLLATEILHDFKRDPLAEGERSPQITQRQREILQLLTEGRSAKEIAAALAISRRTVEFHKYQMMEIHSLHNSAELVHFAIKNGIVAV